MRSWRKPRRHRRTREEIEADNKRAAERKVADTAKMEQNAVVISQGKCPDCGAEIEPDPAARNLWACANRHGVVPCKWFIFV